MDKEYITQLGYQIPILFTDEKIILKYLEDCGLEQPKYHTGKLCYLLNYLRVTPHLKKERYNATTNWVQVHTSVIRKLFGDLKYFGQIMKKLKKDGYVEVYENTDGINSYKKGEYCKKYRLTALINDMEWKVVKYSIYNCTCTKHVANFYHSGWGEIDYELYKMLQKFNIEEIPFYEETNSLNFINYQSEELSIFRQKAETKVAENNKKRKGKRKDFTVEISMKEKYNAYKDYYQNIRKRNYRLQTDSYGRRHTNITNLPKLLRKYLYIIKDGQKHYFKEVDVKNSQVLLLLTILDSSLNNYNKFKDLVETGQFYGYYAPKFTTYFTR